MHFRKVCFSETGMLSAFRCPDQRHGHAVGAAAARDLITAEGYGPQFNHRLGHFIGLKEHEFGDVSSAFDWPVEPGMIFSIEPGIYLAGDVGVRIEDLVLVTDTNP